VNRRHVSLSALLSDAPPGSQLGSTASDTVSAVFSDSREAAQYGSTGLFVAIPGARFDGHDFAASVYDGGCRIFALSHPLPLPNDALQLIYPDTRIALAALSAAFYGHPSRELTVVGITGTKGKTTTALIAHTLLLRSGIPAGYIGTSGIRYGSHSLETANTTPESLITQKIMRDMLDSGIRVLVMEVSSQALMQSRVHGIDFDTVVFTNLSPDHIGGAEHPDFDSYRAEKKKLFCRFGARHILLNSDDPNAFGMLPAETDAIVETASVTGNHPDPRLPSPSLSASRPIPAATRDGFPAIAFELRDRTARIPVILPLPGAFNAENALLALLICRTCGLSFGHLAPMLESVSIPGRCEPIRAERNFRILCDYAHNEKSLREILTALRPYTENRLTVLFGSVGGRTKNRRAPMGRAASELADFCILTSDNPDSEDPAAIAEEIRAGFTRDIPYAVIPDRKEAIRYAIAHAEAGDTILLAGKGHETYQLIDGVKIPFSEREIAEEALRAALPLSLSK
jgi:UDP-N-acetylmuramoyl-L-alanyl-D-glutamate--2,6-diaminopimelate ligase